MKILKIMWVFLIACSLNSWAMEQKQDQETQEKLNTIVRICWISKKSILYKLMEEAERSQNSVKRTIQGSTRISFNGKKRSVRVKTEDPKNKSKRIEVLYPFDDFKKLLERQEPEPACVDDKEIQGDEQPEQEKQAEESTLIPKENNKKQRNCFFC